jgi:hypothetical protein
MLASEFPITAVGRGVVGGDGERVRILAKDKRIKIKN